MMIRGRTPAYILLATITLTAALLAAAGRSRAGGEEVRKAVLAGAWYPGGKEEIVAELEQHLKRAAAAPAKTGQGDICAILVPHAGWRFSGDTAAAAYALLKGKHYKTVFVIGPSHRVPFAGASVPDVSFYETPLGRVRLSSKTRALLRHNVFHSYKGVHEKEHCIEIQLPFLQYTLKDFELVPVVVGAAGASELREIADAIASVSDRDSLLVISSDFTHYGPNYGYIPFDKDVPERIKALDMGAIRFVQNLDPDGFMSYVESRKATICGRLPIAAGLYFLRQRLNHDLPRPRLVAYRQSGEAAGDYTNSVSYTAMAFYLEGGDEEKGGRTTGPADPAPLTPDEKNILLDLAAGTLVQYLNTATMPDVPKNLSPRLKEIQGCFVTLNKNGGLRGCIGHILPREPLYRCVMDNAVNAALRDPRFPRVNAAELKDLDLEVSVLSVPARVSFRSGAELLNKLVPLRDGVVLRQGRRQSTYLPQVWEQLPDKKRFLRRLCLKGGMAADCWQDTDTEVLTYRATVFNR